MAVNIHNLIGAISPDIYCKKMVDKDGKEINLRKEVKRIAEEEGYVAASEKVKLVDSGALNDETVEYANPFKLIGLESPIEKHTLVYDSFSQNLEPIYFWILDKLYQDYKDMKKVDKLIDNFISSSGSSHFAEMGGRATRMQEEAMKVLGAANNVVKSILTLVYDLKEFKTRLDMYDQYRNGSTEERKSNLLSLKQIWMDTVDTKRSTTAIKALAQQFQYVTLIDAFMAAENVEKINELDLNDRVKRLLQQRVGEFFEWLKKSEIELRKRYEIEITYLKSQVNTVYLYARWAKPYLRAARQLEQNMELSGKTSVDTNAALVTAFNTVIFELTLLGQSEYDPQDDVNKGELPDIFKNAKIREYIPIIVVELKFRSIPERAGQQGYAFRGRFEMVFTSYALNEEELKVLKSEIEKDDIGDVLKLIEGATDDSLSQLKEDIDFFLKELDKKKEGKEEKKKSSSDSDDTNPFSSLFSGIKSLFEKPEKKEKKSDAVGKSNEIKPDEKLEEVCRSQAIIKARKECAKFYGLYKKEHEMPAF